MSHNYRQDCSCLACDTRRRLVDANAGISFEVPRTVRAVDPQQRAPAFVVQPTTGWCWPASVTAVTTITHAPISSTTGAVLHVPSCWVSR